MKVKALITAAGMGKRFGALTKATNKSLLSVAGKPLLLDILASFRRSGIRDICLVTGYQARRLETATQGLAQPVYNPFFAVSGILGSFWAAREVLSGHPFVFTTSDHFFHDSILKACMRKTPHIRIVIQKKKAYTKEDAKAIIRGRRVLQLGKDLPLKEVHGEFGGMAYFSALASRYFFVELRSHFENHGLQGYMMEILLKVSHKYGIPILYSLCEENKRIEIDSVHDLITARKMAASFKKG